MKLTPYVGDLSAAQVAVGMNLARKSARRLADDAKIMLERGRWASALALAILSLEETGKPMILWRLALAADEPTRKKAWKEFRRHTAKNPHWIIPEIAAGGGRKLVDFGPAVDGGEHSETLDMLKLMAMYADCYGDARWSDPEGVIDRSLAERIVQRADVLALDRQVTAREVELWIEHVRPHTNTPHMGRAVLSCIAAMKQEGLTEIEPDDLAAFMGDAIGPEPAA